MKRVGLAAIEYRERADQDYHEIGQELSDRHIKQLSNQLHQFQRLLTRYAREHAEKIKSDAIFRSQFVAMCGAIGVDPLAVAHNPSTSPWAQQVGDYYFELAVRVIEICRDSRQLNGGLISLESIQLILQDPLSQVNPIQVSISDIERCVDCLNPLGTGMNLIQIDDLNSKMIRSLPREFNHDESKILNSTHATGGYITVDLLIDNFSWSNERSIQAINDMLNQGLLWIDHSPNGDLLYWSPAWT